MDVARSGFAKTPSRRSPIGMQSQVLDQRVFHGRGVAKVLHLLLQPVPPVHQRWRVLILVRRFHLAEREAHARRSMSLESHQVSTCGARFWVLQISATRPGKLAMPV